VAAGERTRLAALAAGRSVGWPSAYQGSASSGAAACRWLAYRPRTLRLAGTSRPRVLVDRRQRRGGPDPDPGSPPCRADVTAVARTQHEKDSCPRGIIGGRRSCAAGACTTGHRLGRRLTLAAGLGKVAAARTGVLGSSNRKRRLISSLLRPRRRAAGQATFPAYPEPPAPTSPPWPPRRRWPARPLRRLTLAWTACATPSPP